MEGQVVPNDGADDSPDFLLRIGGGDYRQAAVFGKPLEWGNGGWHRNVLFRQSAQKVMHRLVGLFVSRQAEDDVAPGIAPAAPSPVGGRR